MFDVTIPIAFISGLTSFFAPCVAPLLPAYVGYVLGVSTQEVKQKRRKMIITGFLYIVGFSLTFVLLGAAASGLGGLLRRYDIWIQRIGGLFILLMGLQFSGTISIKALLKERKMKPPQWFEELGVFRSFFIGIIFAVSWSPCVGAILGSILTLAAIDRSVIQGAILLFFYSLGISLPFVVISWSLISAPKYLKKLNKHFKTINTITGILLLLLGVLLITGTYNQVNSWILQIAIHLGYKIR